MNEYQKALNDIVIGLAKEGDFVHEHIDDFNKLKELIDMYEETKRIVIEIGEIANEL